MPSLEPFVIAGPAVVLRPLLDILEADPEVAVHTVHRDGRSDPDRLVVSLDPLRATAMQTALGSLVLIEPDEPLTF